MTNHQFVLFQIIVKFLSNMAKSTFEYFSKKYDFFNILDGTIVSAYEGVK